MPREEIVISIRTIGARGARNDITGLGRAANSSIRPLRLLQGLLVGFVGSQALRGLIQYLDAFQGLQNRIRIVTDSTQELVQTTNALFDIANRTRAPVEQIAELFQRGSIAADELGASNEELLQFVEAVGNGLAIQGGSAASASGALTQLSQSLGSGIVRAEEFNSILEGAFPIAQAAARGLDEAGGSVARLRQLVIEGQVTSDEFFRAILSQSDELAETFGQTTATIGQALTQLRNEFIRFVGGIDQANGITQAFVTVIQFLAENLDTIARAIGGLAVSFALLAGPRAIGAAIAAVRALTLAIATNPIGAIAVAIAFVVGQLVAFNDQIRFASTGVATLGDAGAEAFERLQVGISNVVTFFETNFPQITTVARQVIGDVDASFLGLLQIAARVVDGVVGFFRGGFNAISVAAQNATAAIGNFFINAFNAIQIQFTAFINNIINGLNLIPGANIAAFEGGELLDNFEGAGQTAGEAFAEGFAGSTSAQDALGEFAAAVEARAIAREATEALSGSNIDLAQTTDAVTASTAAAAAATGGGGGGAAGATSELNEEVERLNSLYEEVTGGADALAQRQRDLQTLFDSGRISAEQFTAAMRNLNVEVSALDNTFSGGLQNGIDRIIARTNDLGSSVSDFVVGAFDSAREAIVNFARTGEFNVREFFGEIFANLLRLATDQLFAQLLGGLFGGGGAGGGLFGGGGGGGGGFLGGLFGFQNGGSFTVPGNGGIDSQLVAFRATPGETVDVRRPDQQVQSQPVVVQQPPPTVIVNVGSQEIADALTGTPEGTEFVTSAIEANRKSINGVLNS